ncbi:MAG: UTP--glucose-1-phosphate uridylyltransferase GalU [Candidatus Altiarchaeales archaeon]|nr:UTP--glucose-1-phosphate uridylyltransferase GalU [Candidatus Altiarchaeales archaeon]
MKAVIPAAGLGTRFLPATKAMPKEMLPLVDKPAIQFVVEECVDSGIDDILIITGRGKRSIEDHFDHSFELEHTLDEKGKENLLNLVERISDLVDIHYIRQKKALGLGHAILRAKKHVEDEPFCVLLGDDIVFSDTPCIKQCLGRFNEKKGSVIAVESVPKQMISSYGIVDGKELTDGLFEVADLVEKPKPQNAPSNLGIIGRYVLTPEIFDVLSETGKGHGGEIQLTDAMKQLNKNQDFYALKFKGVRYDLGNKLDYLRATVNYALMREDLRDGFRDLLEGL